MTDLTITQTICARVPTNAGVFQLCLYENNHDNKEHLALVMGDVSRVQDVLVRIHSECFTGDVMGSLRCDCGQQLDQAMQHVAQEGQGIIVYLRQEGRGIGLADKLRAYNLQDEGFDTVEANLLLGHKADARDYTIAALILQHLGVHSVRLLTNNPLKIESLTALGIQVTDRIPLHPHITTENAAYLTTKVKRMRHLLNLELSVPAYENGTAVNGRFTPTQYPLKTHPDRPFVTLSYAQSLDGSITARRGQPLAISGSQSLQVTHQLRAKHDAILVGIGTLLADNPRLTVRLVAGTDPQPIVIDSQLRFPVQARLLQNGHTAPWVATTIQADPARQKALETAGARVLRLPATETGQVELAALLARLKKMGVNSLMVEGGGQVITSFLAAQLVDRLVVTISPMLIGGFNALEQPGPFPGSGFPRLRDPHYQRVGQDIILSGEVIWPAEVNESSS